MEQDGNFFIGMGVTVLLMLVVAFLVLATVRQW